VSKFRIVETFKTIEKFNKLSGHRWTEQGRSTGFEVRGGLWCTTKHRSIEAAQKEVALRESIERKFPA
jgi:hypothetical protein